jgi:hypothetical protein
MSGIEVAIFIAVAYEDGSHTGGPEPEHKIPQLPK